MQGGFGNYICIITVDQEWKEMLRQQLEGRYDIKNVSDGVMGEPIEVWRRAIIQNARKIVVGFSEDHSDLAKFSAYIAIQQMLEKNELDSNKLIPVKITENAKIPKECDFLIPGKGYEDDFIAKLEVALGDGRDDGEESFLR